MNIVLSASLTLLLYAQSDSNNILGNWTALEENRQISIYLGRDNRYYGKIINDDSDNSKNGKIILRKLDYDESDKCFKGEIAPPEEDIEINVKVYLVGTDTLKIVAKKFVFTKTLYFQRLEK